MSSPNKKRSKRAAYSHSGCQHCKKVRQKCDEKKPTCSACEKGGIDCVYSRNIIIWQPKEGKKAGHKKTPSQIRNEPQNITFAPPHVGSPQLSPQQIPQLSPQQLPQQIPVTYAPSAPSAMEVSPQFIHEHSPMYGTPNSIGTPVFGGQSAYATPTLAPEAPQDLHEHLSPLSMPTAIKIEPSDFVLSPDSANANTEWLTDVFGTGFGITGSEALTLGFESPETDPPSPLREEVLLSIPKWTERGFKDWCRIMQAYRPSSFVTEADLLSFLQRVFLRSKCGLNYPFGLEESNPLWVNIMKLTPKYDFLKFAVCSVAANVMELECKCAEWAPYRRSYMNQCMQSLIPNIASYHGHEKITALLVTVMILFSEKSATVTNKWRVHLHGAYDLLIARLRPDEVDDHGMTDPLFGVLKTWFSMAEGLAWLSSPGGGTIRNSAAMRSVLDDTHSAELVDGLVLDGFNTFKGYGQSVVPHMITIVTRAMDSSQGKLNVNDPELTNALIQLELLHDQQFSLGAVPQESVRETMRFAHRIHCLALRCYALTYLQGYIASDEPVQRVVAQAVDQIRDMPMFDTLGITVHWPIFAVGKSCVNIEQRSVITNKLNEIREMGAFGARNSLHRLARYWDSYDDNDDDINALAADMDSIAF